MTMSQIQLHQRFSMMYNDFLDPRIHIIRTSLTSTQSSREKREAKSLKLHVTQLSSKSAESLRVHPVTNFVEFEIAQFGVNGVRGQGFHDRKDRAGAKSGNTDTSELGCGIEEFMNHERVNLLNRNVVAFLFVLDTHVMEHSADVGGLRAENKYG